MPIRITNEKPKPEIKTHSVTTDAKIGGQLFNIVQGRTNFLLLTS